MNSLLPALNLLCLKPLKKIILKHTTRRIPFMRIINLITSLAFFTIIISCQKGRPEEYISFSTVLINGKTPGTTITVKVDDGDELSITGIRQLQVPSGERHFIFTDTLTRVSVLDTTITVLPGSSEYFLFQPETSQPVQLLDRKTLGLDTVAAPRPGFLKMRIGGYAKHLPKAVDIHFLTKTYTGNGPAKEVEAGVVYNIPQAGFSDYREVLIGISEFGNQIKQYSIVIKDSETKQVLQNGNVILAGSAYLYTDEDDITSTIYTTYLSGAQGSCPDDACTIAIVSELVKK